MPEQLSINFEAARRARDAGIARVAESSEELTPGWQDRALDLLRRYAHAQVTPFLGEEFRLWAHAHGLEEPHDGRAFGPVFQRAVRLGVIERAGYAPAASSNCSPKPTWRPCR